MANEVITYNGFSFPREASTRARFGFVYDAAGRTVVETKLDLNVSAYILAGGGQDNSLDVIRAALERPGGALRVSGLGLGTLNSNRPGGRKDVSFGPRPSVIDWRNVGAGRAAHIVWNCQVSVLGCLDKPTTGQVMEATYDLTFSTSD